MKKRALLVIMVLATMSIAVPEAKACSCMSTDPRDDLHASDGAFIGTYVGREPTDATDPFGDHDYIFETVKVFKGTIGDVVEVRSASNGAACGLEYPEGARAALFLDEEEGVWHSNLCSTVAPELLEEAAAPFPAPDARGDARLLVGGSFGEVRVLALDKGGRTAGYGYGEGDLHYMSRCPAGVRSVELASDRFFQPPLFVDVRRIADLEVVSTTEAPATWTEESVYPLGVVCVDRAGAAAVFGRGFEKGSTFTELRLFSGGSTSRLYKGDATSAALRATRAYLADGRSIFALALPGGGRRRVATLERGVSHLAISPNGRFLAGYMGASMSDEDAPARLFVLRTRDGRAIASRSTRENTYFGTVDWVSNRRLIHTTGSSTTIRTRALKVSRSFSNWSPQDAIAIGCGLYGIGYGALTRTSVCESRSLATVRTFFTPVTNAILRLPAGTHVDAAPRH